MFVECPGLVPYLVLSIIYLAITLDNNRKMNFEDPNSTLRKNWKKPTGVLKALNAFDGTQNSRHNKSTKE